jgi:hypothetical protein
LEPIIREGDEQFGVDVIMQIMFGMMAAPVFGTMWKRHVTQIGSADLRDRTELAYIKKKLAPPKTQEREWEG